jgi:hypothetical protein
MKNTILVLADRKEPQLAVLDSLRAEANMITGNSAEVFGPAARPPLSSSMVGLFGAAQSGLWNVSERALGAQLRGVGMNVFPELIEGPVPLTNGSGVFSPALAEFVLGAINLLTPT